MAWKTGAGWAAYFFAFVAVVGIRTSTSEGDELIEL